MRQSSASGDGMTIGPPEAQSAQRRFGCIVLRRVLWILLLASGCVLGARAIVGPFRLGVSVTSPMNAESWFSFAALGLLLTNAARTNAAPSARGRRSEVAFAAAVIALAVGAAFGWICRFPFIADDYDHIANALHATPADIANYFTVVAKDRFFRPFAYVAYAAQAHLWGTSRIVWHASSLLLHVANSALVFGLARVRHFGRWTAAAAALLFALAGSRPEAVVWIGAQFDLWATLFFLIALVALVVDSDERRGRRWECVEALALLLALLSKESAYAFVLVAFALLWIDGVRGRRLARLLATPLILTLVVFLYRWHLLGGIGGYRLAGTEKPFFYSFDLVRVIRAFLLRMPAVLTFPLNWTREPGVVLVLLILAAIVAMAVVAAAHADRKKLWFGLAFTLAAAIPVYIFLLIGPDLEKSRVLYLPSVGFVLILAAAFEAMPRRSAVLAACALIAFQTAALEHNLLVWRGVADLAERTCASVARVAASGRPLTVSDVPNTIDGVYFLHPGLEQCVEWYAGKPLPGLRVSAELPELKWDEERRKFVVANGSR
jgi:hypothetical protein